MKKVLFFAMAVTMGLAGMAQSKSDLQDQLTATQQELKMQRIADSLSRNQMQAQIKMLEEKVASQETVIRSYALQVSALNKQMDASSINGTVHFVEGNNASGTYTVPKGKVWSIMSATREPDAKVEGGVCVCYIEVYTKDGIKLGPYTRNINEPAKNPLVLTEGMSFKMALGYIDKTTSTFVYAPDFFKCFVSYTEYNN